LVGLAASVLEASFQKGGSHVRNQDFQHTRQDNKGQFYFLIVALPKGRVIATSAKYKKRALLDDEVSALFTHGGKFEVQDMTQKSKFE